MDCPFHLPSVWRIAAARRRVISATQLDDRSSRRVLHDASTFDEVCPAKSHLTAWRQAEEVLGRILAEIILLDIEDSRERHFPRAGGRVLRVVDCFQFFGLSLGI